MNDGSQNINVILVETIPPGQTNENLFRSYKPYSQVSVVTVLPKASCRWRRGFYLAAPSLSGVTFQHLFIWFGTVLSL